ncbi:hypothetical protein OSG_eHP37_00015 [environmental Halophage eHP-37]|nr:hypothetical protein OSG_eHP37_00015 [environmental Halophage eHP-37]
MYTATPVEFVLVQKATSVVESYVVTAARQSETTVQTHCKNELIDMAAVRMLMHKRHSKIYAMVMRDEYDV